MNAKRFLGIAAAIALPAALAACEEPMPGNGDGAQASSAAATQPAATSSGEAVAMPAGLTRDEKVIWSSLTPEAQRRAVEFMQAGGSFRQFVTL